MKKETERAYMLDTNTVSYFLKGSSQVRSKIIATPTSSLSISAITEGELLFGLAKKHHDKSLHTIVHEFLIRVDVHPWDSAVAGCYGELRAAMQRKGKILGNLDLQIAAHALALELILVTSDRAFLQVDGLLIEDWMS